MPQTKDLYNMVTSVEGLPEFHSTYKDWEYSGANGYLNLTNYIGSSFSVSVPYVNYTNLTNNTFQNKQDLVYIDCNNVPFTGVQSAFQSDYNLSRVSNIKVTDNVTTAQSMFYDCRRLEQAYVNLPSSCTIATTMFTNCGNCGQVILDAPGLTTLTNTFALISSPIAVFLTSPNVTGTTNTWRGSVPTEFPTSKTIFFYFRYSNGTYTPTFNAHKAAQYMGTTGNATTSYISPRYNTSSGFSLYDITTTGGLSTEDNRFIVWKNFPSESISQSSNLTYVGPPILSNSITIPSTMHFKSYPDIDDTEAVTIKSISSTFARCSDLNQNIQIPNSVTDMSQAFSYCTSLNQNIQIPNSVTNMWGTFSGCYNLKGTIRILSEKVTNAKGCYDDFSFRTKYCNVYIPFRYSNGVNTKTFNSFVAANYLYANGVFTGQNKTRVYDLNQL